MAAPIVIDAHRSVPNSTWKIVEYAIVEVTTSIRV